MTQPRRPLRVRRIEAGLSQAELGREAGVNRTTIGRLERGDAVRPAARDAIERVLADRGHANPAPLLPTGPDGEYITVAEAMERFRVSRATLYRSAPADEVTRWRKPGDQRVYLPVAELERRRRRSPATAHPG